MSLSNRGERAEAYSNGINTVHLHHWVLDYESREGWSATVRSVTSECLKRDAMPSEPFDIVFIRDPFRAWWDTNRTLGNMRSVLVGVATISFDAKSDRYLVTGIGKLRGEGADDALEQLRGAQNK